MKIIVACIYLAVVVCAQGQAASSIKYLRLFNIADSGRRARREAGGSGFYITKSSSGDASKSNFHDWGASANSLGGSESASAFSYPGPIAAANSFSLPVSNIGTGRYGASASSGDSGFLINQGDSRPNDCNNFQGWGTAGGLSNQGSSGSNYQGWVPLVDNSGRAGTSSLSSSIKNTEEFSFPVGSSGTDYSYGILSTSGGAGAVYNQGSIRGVGESNIQGWGAGASGFPEPIGFTGNLNPSSTSFSASSTSNSADGSSIQGGNRNVGEGNYQGYNGGFSTSSNQGSHGDGNGSSFQDNSASASSVSYQGVNGGGSSKDHGASTSDVSYQGGHGSGSFQDNSASASNVNYQGGHEAGSFQDNGASISDVNYKGGNVGGSFQDNDASTSEVSYQSSNGGGSFQDNRASASNVNCQGGHGGGSFQDNSASTSDASYQGGNTGGSFQGNSASASNVNYQGTNGGGSFQDISTSASNGYGGRSFQDNGASTSDVSYQGGNGGGSSQDNSASASNVNYQGDNGGTFQGYSEGFSSHSKYQSISVGSHTSEGQNVDPNLLQQIRTILLREEAASGSGGKTAGHFTYGAPSTSYGVPSSIYGAPTTGHGGSGRIIGITVMGIDHSILIAEYHQKSGSSGGGSSSYLPIPSSHYGAPH